ncbi:MAG TPA: cobalamin biosynthesis protein [Mycobacteriales bacterium]|nr:cobalamin biosynthesis protein [Mycobacteriales bacterium]
MATDVRSGRRDLAGAGGLVLGMAVDALLADPARGHPVAWFGRAASRLEAGLWRPDIRAGVLHTATCVGVVVGLAALMERVVPRGRIAVMAAGTWVAVGATSLGREARAIGAQIRDGDLPAARAALPALCGRDPRALDDVGVLRGVLESVAENTSDAVVGPLVYGALAGLPGLLGYRAVNTLDAMIGHRSERYQAFGAAAARLDDVANWVPARLTAALTVVLAPLVGGRPGQAWRTWLRDADAHPSPNAGRPEAAFAGALGVRLGGTISYPYGVQDRRWLGDGRTPTCADVEAAVRLSRLVGLAAVLLAALTRGGWRR